MHIHILGIGGTFMSALALIAREAGHTVTGCDANCYSPVSDLLADKGISWTEGYDDSRNALKADQVVVGNAIKRGMPVIEDVLNAGKHYISGPQWLYDNILVNKKVIAVSGTHGKTTTTSMLSFILHQSGLAPGFLIGGIAPDFNTSASLGTGDWFVIEADEYDSAFFDKRPKFMHYRPEIAIINNLEFDHADIYPDINAIQQQFSYLLRTIPGNGLVLAPQNNDYINDVFAKGYYCRLEQMSLSQNTKWRATLLDDSGSHFNIFHDNEPVAEINWSLMGDFNVENGLAAFAAAIHAGVRPEDAANALQQFTPVKRRLEVKAEKNGITVYDDFAHHPTAIAKTIDALKKSKKHKRILVALEFGSFTMRSGLHIDKLDKALEQVDMAFLLKPTDFSLDKTVATWQFPHQILDTPEAILQSLHLASQPGDGIVIMSNRSFGNLQQTLSSDISSV